MLSIIFFVLLIVVICKLIGLAVKLTWGIFKIGFRIVLLPLALIFMVFKGLVVAALVLLIIGGLLAFLLPAKH